MSIEERRTTCDEYVSAICQRATESEQARWTESWLRFAKMNTARRDAKDMNGYLLRFSGQRQDEIPMPAGAGVTADSDRASLAAHSLAIPSFSGVLQPIVFDKPRFCDTIYTLSTRGNFSVAILNDQGRQP